MIQQQPEEIFPENSTLQFHSSLFWLNSIFSTLIVQFTAQKLILEVTISKHESNSEYLY